MSIEDKQKWDSKYLNKPKLLEPREASLNIQNFIKECKGKKALDLACGAGKNTLYLAKEGFEVDAVDIAKIALDTLNTYAGENDLSNLINTQLTDLDSFTPAIESYDLVIMTNFLDRELIQRSKSALKSDGVFIVETYMQDDKNEKKDSNEEYLLKEGELKDIFSSFEILHYDEFENEPNELYRMKKQVIVAKKQN